MYQRNGGVTFRLFGPPKLYSPEFTEKALGQCFLCLLTARMSTLCAYHEVKKPLSIIHYSCHHDVLLKGPSNTDWTLSYELLRLWRLLEMDSMHLLHEESLGCYGILWLTRACSHRLRYWCFSWQLQVFFRSDWILRSLM
uniref:RIKEN cDNA 9330182O14 gene n=1 Tax=Mus spicilegus TaxID=10103 RepID=A0A8C6GX23_MUSSI